MRKLEGCALKVDQSRKKFDAKYVNKKIPLKMDSLSANSIFVFQNDGTFPPAQKRGKSWNLKIYFREQGIN